MADKLNKKKRSAGGRFGGLLISLIITFSVLFLYILSRPEIGGLKYVGFLKLNLLDIIEGKTLDFRFQRRGAQKPQSNKIVIVEVNEKTHDRLGRWQSTGRAWIANFVDKMSEGDARVIGFDVSFSTTGESAVLESIQSLKTSYLKSKEGGTPDPAYLSQLDKIERDTDYDAQLETALREFGNAILGTYYLLRPEEIKHMTLEQSKQSEQIISRSRYATILGFRSTGSKTLNVPVVSEVEPPIPRFSDVAKSFGHFNVFPDVDGGVRWAPLLANYKNNYYPSLSLQVARFALEPDDNKKPIILVNELSEGRADVDKIQLGGITIPVNEQGKLLINYYGPEKTFQYYNLADVVVGDVSPQEFKDKIVLLGWTGDISHDLHPTAFQSNFPGTEILATVIENILQQDFIVRPASTIVQEILIITALGLIVGFLLPRIRPVMGVLLGLVCSILLVGVVYGAFIYWNLWLNFTFPFLLIALDYVALTSYKYFTEERRKREIRNAFQHYVATAVVDEILEDIEKLKLGGERKHLTAMFSDIRGFTSMSERMKAEELVPFLNEYLTAMTNIVLSYQGTLDKYMGDAIMAFYGAPLPQEDHPIRACKTAIDMMTKLEEMRVDWEAKKYPPLDIGIGINSGDMVVGNMGSHDRFDYTIIGDEVNLASRLEGVNKEYGTHIIISENTYKHIKDSSFIVRELDRIRVKGKKEPIIIYELIGEGTPTQEVQDFIKTFEEGLREYRSQNWDKAIFYFEKALYLRPKDKASKLFMERCQDYKAISPSKEWDGVYEMKTK
jgi:adenylate cyclase